MSHKKLIEGIEFSFYDKSLRPSGESRVLWPEGQTQEEMAEIIGEWINNAQEKQREHDIDHIKTSLEELKGQEVA